MNILLIKIVVVGFMVSEIPRVSVFVHCPYSVTFPYTYKQLLFIENNIIIYVFFIFDMFY